MMTKDQLDLVPTKELYLALRRRCRDVVLLFNFEDHRGGREEHWSDGCTANLLGMMRLHSLELDQEYMASPDDGE